MNKSFLWSEEVKSWRDRDPVWQKKADERLARMKKRMEEDGHAS